MEMQTECLGMLLWSPSAAACLGREVLHRQQSLGHLRASESTTGAAEQFGIGGFNFGFLESAVCVLCVSHIQLDMLLSVLLFEHCY